MFNRKLKKEIKDLKEEIKNIKKAIGYELEPYELEPVVFDSLFLIDTPISKKIKKINEELRLLENYLGVERTQSKIDKFIKKRKK